MMKGRVCVPIHNEHGELVAYAGRWVGPDATIPEHEGKWKLPPRFEKSRVLFNLHRVDEPVHLVVVEGFFDAMCLHVLGLPVVALMGRALSQHQLQLLESAGTQYLTLLLDGDEPGPGFTHEKPGAERDGRLQNRTPSPALRGASAAKPQGVFAEWAQLPKRSHA
jgi:DNA primase